MSDLKDSNECKIIDTINVQQPSCIIQTPCGKFLIGTEGFSIFRYCLKTKQKFRIAGSVDQYGHQDGTRDEARFYYPKGLSLSKDLKTLFVADTCNRVIRAICVGTGVTTTFAGQIGNPKCVNGSKEKACFKKPSTLKLSPDGNTLFVANTTNLRTICIFTGEVYTIRKCFSIIEDFKFCPGGKHIYICKLSNILKINLETNESTIILKEGGYFGFDFSKDGQLLFISSWKHNGIQIFNIATNEIIFTIITCFENEKVLSTSEKLLNIYNRSPGASIQVLDISKYCTNFKTFIQLQLSKYSFLPRQVIKSFSI